MNGDRMIRSRSAFALLHFRVCSGFASFRERMLQHRRTLPSYLLCDKLKSAAAAGRCPMNKYEQRSLQERKSTMKVSLSIFTAVAVLLFVVLVMTGYIGSLPTQPWQKAAVILAAVVLVFRQVGRIARRNGKPKVDPQSELHLNE
jgi:hypothetical protein